MNKISTIKLFKKLQAGFDNSLKTDQKINADRIVTLARTAFNADREEQNYSVSSYVPQVAFATLRA